MNLYDKRLLENYYFQLRVVNCQCCSNYYKNLYQALLTFHNTVRIFAFLKGVLVGIWIDFITNFTSSLSVHVCHEFVNTNIGKCLHIQQLLVAII